MSARRIPPIVMGATVLALCIGCTGTGVQQSRGDDALPSLPQLSVEEGLRDQIARTEFAIARASQAMSKLATECADCQNLLVEINADATERLEVAGGMWEPWTDAQSGEELPQPPEVGDAPLLPSSLVGYMMTTAEEQLAQLSEKTPELSAPLAQILAGRIASALVLANYYGIDPEEASASVLADQLATSVGEPLSVADGAPQSAQSGALSPAEDALETFDCLATASGLGRTAMVNADSSLDQSMFEASLHASLVARQRDLIGLGVNDERPTRCSTTTLSTADLFNAMIAADISLLSSQNPQVRAEGEQLLLADIHAWADWGNPATVTPGAKESTATTEGEDNE